MKRLEVHRARRMSGERPRENRQDPTDTQLSGTHMFLARAIWVAVTVTAMAALVAGLPGMYASLARSLPPNGGDLSRVGVPTNAYMITSLVFALLFVGTYVGVAIVIFVRRSNELMALAVSLFLVAFAVSTPLSAATVASLPPIVYVFANLLSTFAWISLNAFFYVFPNGRFVPRWTWLPLLIVVTIIGLSSLPDSSPLSPNGWPGWLMACFFVGNWGVAIFAQVYRYRRVSGPVQRQQTKWVVHGFVTSTILTTLFGLPGTIWPALAQPGSLYALAQEPVNVCLRLLIPLSLGVAVMRYRLWDIDPVINRTLVYGGLTVTVVAFYMSLVGAAGLLLEERGNLFVSLLATGLIAVLFQPLRERLQRAVNRLMYGDRDDPYAVLARLGQRLEAALVPETVLPTIVETVAGSLRLPYAAIRFLTSEGSWQRVATFPAESRSVSGASEAATPTEPAGSIRLPLVYQNETIGELILAPRAQGDSFTAADRRLLQDLARQVGVAAHAVRLTSDLQSSRERLVMAREEERRRLRRDLHDGLGPTLAALALTAGNVSELIPDEPAAAGVLADKLETGIRGAIGDIRRLVYALRPPSLDELGLVPAIRESAAQVSHVPRSAQGSATGLQVSVEASERLTGLPAAVEVAAYRIAEEALTNVVRHSRARACTIKFSVIEGGRWLQVEIVDNGVGLPQERSAGVGLLSMRERAAELGGSCTVESAEGGGTRICARLPLPEEN